MDLALFAEPAEPETAVDWQTADRNPNSSLDSNTKRVKTSRESQIMLYNTEYLQNNYEKYIRDDFLYAFGAFYCDKVMKIPLLDRVTKTKCYHPETDLNYSHCEFATYMKNIIGWVDLKLNYLNGESFKCNKKTKFKTGYIKIGQQTTRISLDCKALDSNTDSQEHTKKLKSVINIKNEIIISPNITTPKLDFPVNNIQDEIITSPDITSPKHDISGCSTNNRETEITVVKNTPDEIITSSDITSPKLDIPGSSTNNQETEISVVNNIQDEIIISPDITSPKHDISGCSTNNQETEIAVVKNTPDEIITSSDITSPKLDIPGCSINDQETDIAVRNTQTKIITSPEIISPKHNLAGSSTNDHKKTINMVNYTQDEIITLPDIVQTFTSPKHDIPENPTNAQKREIAMEDIQSEIIPSPKHTFTRSSVKYRTKRMNKINSNLVNISSTAKSRLGNSKFKSPVISNEMNVKESTSENLENCANDKIVNEDEFYSAQTSFDTVIDAEISSLCLNTSSTNVRYTRGNKQTSKNVDKTSTTPLKRSNSVTNSDHSSKKKKIEKPPSNVERKTTANNDDEFYSAQTSFDTVIDAEVSSLCLNTSTNVRYTRGNKQTSKNVDKTSTTPLNRSNSVTNSDHSSKKKKIEKPPSNVERKTTANNDRNSVKALNESTKQVIKNVYTRNSKGETKLHSACAKGKLNLVTSLLEDGFNPNVKDNAGWTPMHEAVKSGSLDIVQELIKYGAYLNVPGFEYESPLYTAIKYGKFEIAITLLNHGADANFINMYGNNARDLNEEKLSELLENQVSCISTQTYLTNYTLDEIVIVLNNVSLNCATVNTFCKQFNIKLVQNIMNEKQLAQVTHMIVPKTNNNACDVNLECLIGIANGLFIINENWISDSLDKNKLVKCENYEVSGTQFFADCNGPNISRISKQKLNPKLFNGINVHICGTIGWKQFSLEHLKKLVVEFGAKILIRMPNPENCPTNIIPYHCRNNDQMLHVSNIILYTMDSNRLIKYNMKHLKAFHISWFMEAVQKYNII